MPALTVSGNEITDATRTTNTQGDGRAVPDSTFGIWEAATNLVTNGGFEGGSIGVAPTTWVALSSTLTVQATAKFGTKGMQVVAGNAATNEGASITFTGAAATKYSVSAWVRLVSGAATVRVTLFDSVAGKQGSAGLPLTTAWQRISVTATTGAASSGFAVYVETTAQQAGTFAVDGVQCEAKAWASPYVNTTNATATRAVASVQAPWANFITEAQGCIALAATYDAVSGGQQGFFSLDDGTGVNRILLYNDGTQYILQHIRNSSAGTSCTVAGAPVAGATVLLVVAWTNTGGAGNGTLSLSVNGAAFVTQNRPAAAGGAAWATLFTIGSIGAGSLLHGRAHWFAMCSGTLASGDLATINGYGTSDPTLVQLQVLNGGTAQPTFRWTCDDTTYNKGGFDYGFLTRCVKGYLTGHPDISSYTDMQDDVYQAFSGQCYNLSTEAEANQGRVFTPQAGQAGQAYPIGSRYSSPLQSPMQFDFTAGLRSAGTAYQCYLREDFVNFLPLAPSTYHWLGLTDYQDKGDGTAFGPMTAMTQTATLNLAEVTNTGIASVVMGATVTAGGTYTVAPTGVSFAGGTGTAATAHPVMNAAGTAVTGVIIDTPGSYTVAPTSMTITGGTFSVQATATPITGTGNLYRAICGLLCTYSVMTVTTIPILTPGSGYGSAPTVTIAGGTGGGATATATVGTGATAGQVTAVTVVTPGSYTVAPTTASVSGGTPTVAATLGTPVTTVVPFFGAIDCNMYFTPGFPKDAIYVTNAEPKVRACVQGVAPGWYGFASIDAASYGGLAIALGGAATAKTISWSVIFNYLTTTIDQKVGSNGVTPNAASATPYFPRPLNGVGSVLVKGVNYAVEASLPALGNKLLLDYVLTGMHCDY